MDFESVVKEPQKWQVRFFGIKNYPPQAIAEAAILPSGTIVLMTVDDGRGRESLWFDADGTNPKGNSVIELR